MNLQAEQPGCAVKNKTILVSLVLNLLFTNRPTLKSSNHGRSYGCLVIDFNLTATGPTDITTATVKTIESRVAFRIHFGMV